MNVCGHLNDQGFEPVRAELPLLAMVLNSGSPLSQRSRDVVLENRIESGKLIY